MKNYLWSFLRFIKNFILFLRPGLFLHFISFPLLHFSQTLKLTRWIARQPKGGNILNDFFVPVRDPNKRYMLYDHVAVTDRLKDTPIVFMEFGVSKGNSFKWWLNANTHPDSRFYGFDTFSGLPEDWGKYKKGDMAAYPEGITDPRHEFIKGLFQDTLYPFLESGKVKKTDRKVIHLDADLFSATLFVLTSLRPILHKDDILIFDEFNVPAHEFMAFMFFTESFYIEYELVGAVNNFFHAAFRLK